MFVKSPKKDIYTYVLVSFLGVVMISSVNTNNAAESNETYYYYGISFKNGHMELTDSNKRYIDRYIDTLSKIDEIDKYSLFLDCISCPNELETNKYINLIRAKNVKDYICENSNYKSHDVAIRDITVNDFFFYDCSYSEVIFTLRRQCFD